MEGGRVIVGGTYCRCCLVSRVALIRLRYNYRRRRLPLSTGLWIGGWVRMAVMRVIRYILVEQETTAKGERTGGNTWLRWNGCYEAHRYILVERETTTRGERMWVRKEKEREKKNNDKKQCHTKTRVFLWLLWENLVRITGNNFKRIRIHVSRE